MAKIPSIRGEAAIRAFAKVGFRLARISSSHHILKKPGVISELSIPVHAGKTIKPGLLRSQIRAAGLTVDEFIALLD